MCGLYGKIFRLGGRKVEVLVGKRMKEMGVVWVE